MAFGKGRAARITYAEHGPLKITACAFRLKRFQVAADSTLLMWIVGRSGSDPELC